MRVGEPGRVLFVAYYFPPLRTVACLRTYAIAKWLSRAGWQVTVLTPRSSVWRRTEDSRDLPRKLARDGIRCLRTPHPWRFLAHRETVPRYENGGWLRQRAGERIARWFRRLAGRLGLPDEIGWLLAAQRAASRLEHGRFDLVLATGSPFSSFGAARRIARRLRCGFVLDYRDLWAGNPFVRPGSDARAGRREQRFLDECLGGLAVSPGMVHCLEQRYGVRSKLTVVSNGFDTEDLAGVVPRDFGHFAIVYAGRFYPPRRAAGPLMASLSRLATVEGVTGRAWAFHYYGRDGNHVREEARIAGVAGRIVLHGDVSHREALSAVGGAGVVVVMTSVARQASLEEQAIVTGKVFEAIGLATPILAIAPPGSDLEKVLQTAGRGRCLAADDLDGIARYLADVMEGRVPPARDPGAFDWARLGPELDRQLRGFLAAQPPTAITGRAGLRPPERSDAARRGDATRGRSDRVEGRR
jgi:glycosyltransferase involved in cell wall biosynthesis